MATRRPFCCRSSVLFSRELLFLHVPKAAGMSITEYLLDVLPRPVYYTSPPGHESTTREGAIHIDGSRHETLAEAEQLVGRFGHRLQDFRVILAAMRNPYDLEVSRFAYLRKGYPWDRGADQELAMSGDFELFALNSPPHGDIPLEEFFTISGAMPSNVRVVRFERLKEDLSRTLDGLDLLRTDVTVPHVNRSKHGHYARYYTEAAEEAVYEKYRWLFEQGFYPRLQPSQRLRASTERKLGNWLRSYPRRRSEALSAVAHRYAVLVKRAARRRSDS
jgi:hypothetical protein